MLSLFPQILFLAPFSGLLIRFALFCLLSYAAWRHVGMPTFMNRAWGVLEMVAALLLLMGAWTQAVAIIVCAGVAVSMFVPSVRIYPKSTLLLALAMCASLVVTGAGALAFDLPL